MKKRKRITLLTSQIIMGFLAFILIVLCIFFGFLLGMRSYLNGIVILKFAGITISYMLLIVLFYITLLLGILVFMSQYITNYIILFWNRIGMLIDPKLKRYPTKWIEVTSIKTILNKTKNTLNLVDKIYSAGSFNETLEYIFNTFSAFIPFDYIGVALVSDDGNYIEALKGISDKSNINLCKKLSGHKVKISETSLVKVIKDGQPRVINNLKKYLEQKPDHWYNRVVLEEGISASITLPLYINDNIFGVIFFSSIKANVYRTVHTNMLDILASTIAASFNKNILIHDILLSSTIALAKITESRDNDTGDHLNRIKVYSRLLALLLSKESKFKNIITEEYIDDIEKFSPLHDIGKVAIPDHILLKPGKLTKEEFEIMKTHAVFGAKVLKEADDNVRRSNRSFFSMGIEIAEGHHEKYDGSGYPNGKKGEDIPLSARIVALADVFDALTSKRPYKNAFSFTEAYEIITEDSGRHFDPEIIKVFVKNRNQFYDTYKILCTNARQDKNLKVF